MISNCNAKHQRDRTGFTLIELLVSISIIATLIALTLPAVNSARESSRSLQCKNHLHNLGIAMVGNAEANKRYPAAGYIGLDASGNIAEFHNWVVSLLPYLDNSAAFSLWDRDLPAAAPANRAISELSFKVLVCPTDITTLGQGDLSYAVNGGFGWTSVVNGVGDCPVSFGTIPFDLNGNGISCSADSALDGDPSDKKIYLQTGMFFIESWQTPGTTRHHTPDSLSVDGMGHTLMIAENVRVGYDPSFPDVNWASSDPLRNSFFLPPDICEDNSCAPGKVDYSRANRGLGAINSSLTKPEGEAPWPSSYHSGGVNVAFADGRVEFLSESIDGAVYAALVSPQGSLLTGALSQRLLSDSDF